LKPADIDDQKLLRYRRSDTEQLRTSDILRLLPVGCASALDVGARDGHFSRLVAQRVPSVTALDLEMPDIDDPRVQCVQGDITRLQFADDSFDLVVCTEVLEHIDPDALGRACSELTRVCGRHLLVGVPYRQDIRVGRTTCCHCGVPNPPWGHRSVFDDGRLRGLFPSLHPAEVSYVGINRESTNAVARVLLDLAGNPYGTYGQDEACLGCGGELSERPPRNFSHKVFSKSGHLVRRLTERFRPAHANWLHILFEKRR
jgi:SAM-dependent methyltransferase